MSQPDLLALTRESDRFKSDDEADRTIRATLDALADSLTPGERRDLAEPLPERYASHLEEAPGGRTTPLDLEEFLDRVETEADVGSAEPRVRAVLAALGEIVGEDELADARAQLPPEYGRLFEPATVTPETTFADLVGEAGGFDEAEAETAARATLDELGRRLSEGEAEDIAQYLRGDAADWLARTASHEAEPHSPKAFVAEVAESADASESRAEAYVGAVADALVETVPEAERERAEAQLPDQYASVLDLEA
ncbi:MAG: DUF2267 domain-containing protein [Haloglomus sp.]